jgi:hypothetical protein
VKHPTNHLPLFGWKVKKVDPIYCSTIVRNFEIGQRREQKIISQKKARAAAAKEEHLTSPAQCEMKLKAGGQVWLSTNKTQFLVLGSSQSGRI